MNRAASTWRSSLWARWLGWTLVFALVVAASLFASIVVGSRLPPNLRAVFVVPSIIAAFLLGVRFRSLSWLTGPVVVVTVLYAFWGLTTQPGPETMDYHLGINGRLRAAIYSVVGLVAGSCYAIPVLLGVWWGVAVFLTFLFLTAKRAFVTWRQRRETSRTVATIASSRLDA